MRITKVSVKKLFGIFDHEIPLNQDSRITIIHGPNGFGKTVLLRMIDSFFNSNYSIFFQVPFSVFRIEFDIGERIEVRSNSETSAESENQRTIVFDEGKTSPRVLLEPKTDGETDWLARILDEVSTKLIGTQRLQSEYEIKPDLESHGEDEYNLIIRPKVIEYSESLAKRVQDELGAMDSSIQQTQELDSKLQELATLESDENAPVGMTDERKLGILERLKDIMDDSNKAWASSLERNELVTVLKQIIDGLFVFKQLLFSEEGEFAIVAGDGKTIPLTSLSSGEQHQLVLFYELLFLVPRGCLVMIDEPELSLHVTWQRRFLDDIREIVRLRNLDVLIATHSPQIVNDKYDWMVDLNNPEAELADDVAEYA